MSLSLIEIRDAIQRRELKAVEAVEEALRQVRKVDVDLHAATEVLEEEALQAAADVDAAMARGQPPGPLAGVPYTAKDLICTPWGRTPAASKILENYRAPYAATVIEKLAAAGAVCVAKSNMDEFGMGSSTENSGIIGPTRNPWALSHVPGGSSGGAAALAAATRGMFHLGSDTGGSIRQPASYCGVTGFKPTYGRVSRYGLLAFASSLDQIGVLETTARGCAMAMESMAGWDEMDSTSSREPVPRYLKETAGKVKGLTLGVPAEYFPEGIDPEVRERVQEGIEVFRGLKVKIREVSLPHTRYANPTYVLISAAEASSNLARYDGIHYGHRAGAPKDLLDLTSRSRLEGFGPEVKRRIMVGTFVLSSGYYDAFYSRACKVRNLIRRDFENVFQDVDAVICPTSPVPAFALGEKLDDPLKLYAVDVLTVPANLAGLPGISFPCGFTREHLPVGLQIYGRPFEDGKVLRLACAFQGATSFHLQAPPVRGWSVGD